MRRTFYNALKSYFNGHIQKHVANIKIHTDASVGVAEHSDIMDTIEKELALISEYEDKLMVLKKYFGDTKSKEVLNG